MRCRTMILASGCLGLLLIGNSGKAQNPSGGAVTASAEDRKFLLDAAQSGRHEVQMGMAGVERGTNHDLKAYAEQILDDHMLSNAEIEALARLKGVELPAANATDSSVAELSRLSGLQFDQEFVRESVADHLKDLAAFQKEDQASAADSDIKGFAHSALPKIQAHLEQAKALKP